jgi:phage terminase small subunit
MSGPDRLNIPGATRRGDARRFGENRGNGIRGMPKHGAAASDASVDTCGAGAVAGNPPPAFPLASARQELFCLEYLKDMKGTKAAIRAGYSQRSATSQACNLLAVPAVAARIAQLMAERAQRLRFDADRVITLLCAVVERCMQTAPVLDRKGEPVLVQMPNGRWVPGYDFDALGAIRALELIGRHLGLFTAEYRQRQETEPSTEELVHMLRQRDCPEARALRMAEVNAQFEGLEEEFSVTSPLTCPPKL